MSPTPSVEVNWLLAEIAVTMIFNHLAFGQGTKLIFRTDKCEGDGIDVTKYTYKVDENP